MNRFHVLCFLLTIAAPACGGNGDDSVDLSARDPRCVAACPDTMPEHDGVGRVCDTASRGQCLDECEARIAGLGTVCQNCLVERACFAPGGCFGDTTGGSCTETTCTLTSEFGTCSYPVDDQAAYITCLQKIDPRRTVSCEASFRPATDCASVCS
jgi:hypothetical protein